MWTIIIITVIAILVTIFYEYKYGYWSDIIDYFLMALIGLIAGSVFGGGIALALPTKTEIVKLTYYIETLQDNNGISGQFFLGCGQVDDKMKYVFYRETNGYYQLEQVDCEKTMIKYSNGRPKVEEFVQREVKGAFINNFAIDWNLSQAYIIYVPIGTIKQSYTLDAQ